MWIHFPNMITRKVSYDIAAIDIIDNVEKSILSNNRNQFIKWWGLAIGYSMDTLIDVHEIWEI